MNPNLTDKLKKNHPQLYGRAHSISPYKEIAEGKSTHDLVAAFGFDCGDGWFTILDTLAIAIRNHIKTYGYLAEDKVEIKVMQIKEKFGTLCWYYCGGDETIRGMVGLAECWSEVTCERCGNPGSIDYSRTWQRCLCEKCRKIKSRKD